MNHEQEERPVHYWERKLLVVAFTAWAAVVAAYGQMAINRVDRIVDTMSKQADVNSEAHQILDRRLTIAEQRQEAVIQALSKIETHIEKELHAEDP